MLARLPADVLSHLATFGIWVGLAAELCGALRARLARDEAFWRPLLARAWPAAWRTRHVCYRVDLFGPRWPALARERGFPRRLPGSTHVAVSNGYLIQFEANRGLVYRGIRCAYHGYGTAVSASGRFLAQMGCRLQAIQEESPKYEVTVLDTESGAVTPYGFWAKEMVFAGETLITLTAKGFVSSVDPVTQRRSDPWNVPFFALHLAASATHCAVLGPHSEVLCTVDGAQVGAAVQHRESWMRNARHHLHGLRLCSTDSVWYRCWDFALDKEVEPPPSSTHLWPPPRAGGLSLSTEPALRAVRDGEVVWNLGVKVEASHVVTDGIVFVHNDSLWHVRL